MAVVDENGNRYVPRINGRPVTGPVTDKQRSKMTWTQVGGSPTTPTSSSGGSSGSGSNGYSGQLSPVQKANLKYKQQQEKLQHKINSNQNGDHDKDGILNRFDGNDLVAVHNPSNKDLHKQQVWLASNKPSGDFDGDGLRNNVDPNNKEKNVVNAQSKTKIVQKKVVLGGKTPILDNNTLFMPLEVKEELKRIEAEDKKSYVVKQDLVSKQWYIMRTTEKTNKKYNKKLDADGDGKSGTLDDYKIISNNKAKEKSEEQQGGSPEGTTPGARPSNGSQGSGNGDGSGSGSGQNSAQHSSNNSKGNKRQKQNNKNGAGGNSNSNKEQDVVAGLYGNGNVNNIKMRLANAYGSDSANKVTFDELVAKFRAEHGEGSVVTTGTPGSYNYNAVFTIDGKKTDDLNAITKATAKYLVDGGGSTDNKELKDEKLNYLTPNSARVVTNRFGRAFGGGDVTKGQESLSQAIASLKATNPGKIKINGTPGAAGYSIEVKVNGEWSNKADDIAMVLGKHVDGVDLNGKKDKKVLPKHTANILDGANGNAVTDRFLSMYGPENYNKKLDSALAKYEKAGGKVKEHGVRGQNGYYIELVAKNGNHIVDTDKIMDRLDKYASDKLATPYIKPPTETSTPVTGVPLNGADPTPGSEGKQTPFLPTGVPKSWGRGSFSKPDKNNPLFDEWQAVNNAFKKLEIEDKKIRPGASQADIASYQKANAQLQLALDKYDKASNGAITKANNSPIQAAVMPQPVYGSPNSVTGPESEVPQNEQPGDGSETVNSKQEIEKKQFKELNGKFVEVDLGEAARKSQAIMAADLNNNDKVSRKEASLLAPADANNNGIVGVNEVKAFVNSADTNNSGKVSSAESRAFNVLDVNNSGTITKREVNAYNSIDKNGDGDITKKEAKAALAAQIDNKKLNNAQDDLAKQYLAKSENKGGGAQAVDEQVAALVNAQPKHDRSPKDNDGPGKKKKKD